MDKLFVMHRAHSDKRTKKGMEKWHRYNLGNDIQVIRPEGTDLRRGRLSTVLTVMVYAI